MANAKGKKSSYLNRTGSVFYIGRHCEFFFDGYDTLDDAVRIVKKAFANSVDLNETPHQGLRCLL